MLIDLLSRVGGNCSSARNFNSQNINLNEILNSISIDQPIELNLKTPLDITDENYKNIQIIEDIKIEKEKWLKNKKEKEYTKSSNIELDKNKHNDLKYNNFHPSSNYISSYLRNDNKNPTFFFGFKLDRKLYSPATMITDVFLSDSNSWSLKLDLKENGDFSIYLIERGIKIFNNLSPKSKLSNTNTSSTTELKDFILKFTSVLFEFEVKINNKGKSGVIFYSFCTNQHEIIGYGDFLNLFQKTENDSSVLDININIWIKENNIHAACLDYICENFKNFADKNNKDLLLISMNNVNTIRDINCYDLISIISSDYKKG